MPEIELHAQQWLHHQQSAAYLLRGAALADILTIYIKTSDRLSPLCHDFITACLDERDKQQKLAKRRVRGFWIGGWIIALILTGMGLWEGQKLLLDYLLSDIDAISPSARHCVIAHWEKSSKADLDWQSQDRLIKDWNKREFLQEFTERDLAKRGTA